MIPVKLARSVVAWEGDRGRAWLERLPALVESMVSAWDIEVGEPFEPGGNISWVAPARRRVDGRDAVLKLQLPHPESDPEAAGLMAWAGAGAAELLAHDPDRRALLLERCRPGTALIDRGGDLAAVRVGAAIGARLHAVDPPAGVPILATVLDLWADELAGRLLRRPVADPGLGRRAVATMRERPRACSGPVLLHGDLNPTNVLASERAAWLAIDPKPMVGDPAYDGPRLVLQPHPASGDELATRISAVVEGMGLDRAALVDWCLVAAVEMGSSADHHGDATTAAQCEEQVRLLAPLLH